MDQKTLNEYGRKQLAVYFVTGASDEGIMVGADIPVRNEKSGEYYISRIREITCSKVYASPNEAKLAWIQEELAYHSGMFFRIKRLEDKLREDEEEVMIYPDNLLKLGLKLYTHKETGEIMMDINDRSGETTAMSFSDNDCFALIKALLVELSKKKNEGNSDFFALNVAFGQ